MVFSFLNPIDKEVVDQVENLPALSVGKKIKRHTANTFPDLTDVKVVILGVLDTRGGQKKCSEYTINYIRLAFYKLFPGNWDFKLADLGDVPIGENVSDTYFVLQNVIKELLQSNKIPIVIGGSQDHVYPIYRAFDYKHKMLNYVAIDSKLDFKSEGKSLADSYLTKIVLDEPNNLFNFANIGYQTYLNSQDEINVIESLNFDAFRLGEVTAKIHLAEPIIRDASIVSIDMTAAKSADSGNFVEFSPNGFDGKEMCILSRYAGISESVSCFGIFNQYGTKPESYLIAQIIWYFIEGLQYRVNERVNVTDKNFTKFIIPLQEMELVFYKSLLTERWWIELQTNQVEASKMIIPCSKEDYLNALSGEIPERWWKVLKKNLI